MTESIDFKDLNKALETLKKLIQNEALTFPTPTPDKYKSIKDGFGVYQAMVRDSIEIFENARTLASISDAGLKKTILRQASPFLKGHFTMAVVGRMSAGKSTFINAFLRDHNLLPTGHLQTTCTLTTIKHSDIKRLKVIYGDDSEKEYHGDFGTRLKELVSIPDIYQSLPVNAINKLILNGKTKQEILSEPILSELACASGVSNAQLDQDLLAHYVDEHPECAIPIEVGIECPLPEEYRGWYIVDTPGVDAIGGIENETKVFLGGKDAEGNYNVDAIIFVFNAKENSQAHTLNEFIASTLDSVSEEARKRSFLIINKASDDAFQAHKEDVLKQLDNLYVKTGKIAKDRILIVDSLFSLLADDLTLDYKYFMKKTSPIPDNWSGWDVKDWELNQKYLRSIKGELDDDDHLEVNNENIRKRLLSIANFNSVRDCLLEFVKAEKATAFRSIIETIGEDIVKCIEIKEKDLAVLNAGLGQSPEEFRKALEQEREKLNNFQLKSNRKMAELNQEYTKANVRNRFSQELQELFRLKEKVTSIKNDNHLAFPQTLIQHDLIREIVDHFIDNTLGVYVSDKDFSTLPSWEEMLEMAAIIDNNVTFVAESIKSEITAKVKGYLEQSQIDMDVTLSPIDFKDILSRAREYTATYETETVRVEKKKGLINGAKRAGGWAVGWLIKNDWGWETKEVTKTIYNDAAASRQAVLSLINELDKRIKAFVEDLLVQIDTITEEVDKMIKDKIKSRKEAFNKMEEKNDIAQSIDQTKAEIVILNAALILNQQYL